MVKIDIILDKPSDEVFTAGETVKGIVRVVVKENILPATRVILFFGGLTRTHWVYGYRHRQSCNAHDEMHLTLWKGIQMAKGILTFPILFHLPEDCLPSIQSKFGSIRYKIDASIYINDMWKRIKKAERKITVIALPTRFDMFPVDLVPQRQIETHQIGYNRNDLHVVQFRCSIPRTSFLVGENVPLHVLIYNHSMTTLMKMKVILIRIIRLQPYMEPIYKDMKRKHPKTRDPFACREIFSKDVRTEYTDIVIIKQPIDIPPYYKGDIDFSLEIPHETIPTICRSEIQVEYKIQIELIPSIFIWQKAAVLMNLIIAGSAPTKIYKPKTKPIKTQDGIRSINILPIKYNKSSDCYDYFHKYQPEQQGEIQDKYESASSETGVNLAICGL